MSWLDFFKKKVPVVEVPVQAPEVVEAERIKNTMAPSVFAYPKKDYTAYWEVVEVGNKVKLRIYTYPENKEKSKLLDENVYEAADLETAKKLAWRAITSKMDKYKR